MDDIITKLKELEIEPALLDEIVAQMKGGKTVEEFSDDVVLKLKEKIDETDDWRTKAKLAARIISHGLDE